MNKTYQIIVKYANFLQTVNDDVMVIFDTKGDFYQKFYDSKRVCVKTYSNKLKSQAMQQFNDVIKGIGKKNY